MKVNISSLIDGMFLGNMYVHDPKILVPMIIITKGTKQLE